MHYIADPKMSHGRLAKRYGVAKSTITRYATKHNWQEQREKWQEKRAKKLRKLSAQKQNEIDEKHLKKLQLMQTVIHNDFMRIAIKQQEGDEVTHQEMHRLFGHVKPMIEVIMAERVILNLPTRPVRLTDPQDIEEYQIMMGYKDPPLNKTHEDLKDTAKVLDRMIARRKMIQGLIDSYDR